MKKLVIGVLMFVLSVAGAPMAHAAEADNFTISSYDVQMTLARDGENRSVLKTVETITAQFPDYDQNHGLERVFVKEYDGHSTSLTLQSVTDANGNSLEYHWSGDALRIGNADTYVQGTQTYVITFTQRDVTKYFADMQRDEFYWDVLGFDARVPIQQAAVRLTLDAEIMSYSGQSYCYQGLQNSTEKCELTQDSLSTQAAPGEKRPLVYTGSYSDLGNGKGVSVSIGFMSGTFSPYKQSFLEKLIGIWIVVQFIVGPLGIIALIWFIIRWYKRMNRSKELGTIVPEYLPPKDASVTASARVGGYNKSVMTAQMIDFAVRHYVKIYEAKEKTVFAPAQYEIEVVQGVSELRPEEQEILKDTFGGLPSLGSRLNLKELQNNPAYYRRTLNNDADLDKLVRGEYGFREDDAASTKWARRMAFISLSIGIVFLSVIWLIVALVMFGMSFVSYRLTDKGLELKRYLEGLKMYIGVAEEERLKMLQSPEGAEKVADVAQGTDSAQLIKLYERVLPYAVLFGQEKEWNKQLGHYYEVAQAKPDWYAGQNAVFNAAVFSNAMSSFSSASSAASSYSSSSGGSSGGGFAGGGGGGGGVGGW